LTACSGIFCIAFQTVVIVAYREFGEGLVRIRCLAIVASRRLKHNRTIIPCVAVRACA